MMLKIKKFKNVYGIKELCSAELIDGNTIIYAPNGSMKTSFADGINDISNGHIPGDLFCNPRITSQFKILNNGVEIDNQCQNIYLDAFVFKISDYSRDVFNDQRINTLVMSNSLKTKYKKLLDNYEKTCRAFTELLSKNVFALKNTSDEAIKIMSFVVGKESIPDIIESIPDVENYNDEFYKSINYIDLFNEKTDQVLNTPQFVSLCENYNKYVSKKLDETVFNSGFDFNGIKKLQKDLKSIKFFNAGHKINLNSVGLLDEKQFDEYIESVVQDVYDSEESRTVFEEAKRVLNKNAQSRKALSIISKDKRCLNEMFNVSLFKKNIIFTKLNPYSKDLKEYKKEIIEYKKGIKEVIKEAEKSKELWVKIIETYNNRFITNKFDVKIENIKDAVLGINPPIFKKIIRGTDNEITTEIFNRFSSGEKRAIMILNLLFEVEFRKGTQFTLVLDDISDSFDYKNKYAIIECLKDFVMDRNIQLIILTHNFDFYRSVRISLGSSLNSKLMAYSSNNIVSLYNAKTKEFENYSFFSNWKNRGQKIDAISCLPFLRNLIQLQNNAEDSNYKKVTKFLHYNPDIDSAMFSEINNILDSFKVIRSFPDFKYLDELREIAKSIIYDNSLNEMHLKEKVVLGLFIRIFTDKYMWKKYVEINRMNPSVAGELNQSKLLFDEIKNDLNKFELETIQMALIVSPSFIHVNSFMFEPLVDVGTEKLKDVAKKIYNLTI